MHDLEQVGDALLQQIWLEAEGCKAQRRQQQVQQHSPPAGHSRQGGLQADAHAGQKLLRYVSLIYNALICEGKHSRPDRHAAVVNSFCT